MQTSETVFDDYFQLIFGYWGLLCLQIIYNRASGGPLFLCRGENQMRSHPDYHAHFLLLEPGFRGIQWLRAMDYEGLPKEDSKQSHHTEHVYVFVWSVRQYGITLIFPSALALIESRREREKEEDSGGVAGEERFLLQANNWAQRKYTPCLITTCLTQQIFFVTDAFRSNLYR